MEKILLTGACGQLGSEIAPALARIHGNEQVIISDLKQDSDSDLNYEQLDVLNKDKIAQLLKKHKITQIYHLAAVLSAKAENNPEQAWDINMKSLLNILSLAVEHKIKKVFWPSSIAVFGPDSPKTQTPQLTLMNPSTVYGISKLAGEKWLEYFHSKYNLDVRSIRYPGIISYKTLPGGGTTDYAVEIFHKLKNNDTYHCFLSENTLLPMMYIEDAIRATTELMEAPSQNITIRSAYNLAAVSFTPENIFKEIKKYKPSAKIQYSPDFRQQIANSWPGSINDAQARKDWGWQHQYQLPDIVREMINNV